MWANSPPDLFISLNSIVQGISCFAYARMIDIANSEFVQNACLSVILWNSRIQTNVYLFVKNIYDQNELIRGPVDFALWTYETIETMTLRQKLEPTSNRWIQVCSLVKEKDTSKNSYHYFEICDKTNSNMEETDMDRCFDEYRYEKGYINEKYDDCDSIAIMKWDGKYKVRKISEKASRMKTRSSFSKEMEPSCVRMLSVEYTAPSKAAPILLKIPREMYIQGNELFSAAFVYRALEYQPEPFEFDMEYVLKIMDGEIRQIELRKNQYIIIEENDYCVKEI